MLDARALFYSLVLMLFVASSSGIFIVSAQVYQQQQTDQFHNQQARYNIQSGISMLKAGQGNSPGTYIQLYEDWSDSIYLERYPWGLLDLGIVVAKTKDLIGVDSIFRVVSLGQLHSKLMENAIYLKDGNSALAVAGQTKIFGNAAIPKLGIKKTTINGISFQGSTAVVGTIKHSTGFLPTIPANRLDKILTFRELEGITSITNNQINRSFREPLLLLSGTTMDLADLNLSGRIVITASTSIYVPASCQLEDVILLAPKITFEKGFQGNCQAFATQHLEIAEEVLLNYPSVLGLLADNPKVQATLTINTNSEIQGIVLVKSMAPLEKKPIFKLEKEALLYGMAYVNGMANLGGKIIGSLIADKLIIQIGGSVYTNHLYNATIDRVNLSSDYTPLLLEKETVEYSIAQWLE